MTGASDDGGDLRDVVVVGGGIAGLAAAWRLREHDVLLLEADERLGGRMRSDPRGDYWMNYGAHLFPAPGTTVDRMARDCGHCGRRDSDPAVVLAALPDCEASRFRLSDAVRRRSSRYDD